MAPGGTRRTVRSADQNGGPGTAPGVRAARLLKELIDHQLVLLRSKRSLNEQQAADAWRELVRRQLRKDRQDRERKSQPRLPGRMRVVHPVTFQRLYAELEQPDAELGSDRQALVEAVAHLCAEPPFRGHMVGPKPGELLELGYLLPPSRTAGDGGWAGKGVLEAASSAALGEADRLDNEAEVSLSQVYIARGCEEQLARRLLAGLARSNRAPRVELVLGEPGTGKTSLLWNLTTRLTGRSSLPDPQVDENGGPRDGSSRVHCQPLLLRADDLLLPRGTTDLLTLFDRQLSQPAYRFSVIVLLDSADVLLADDLGRAVCRELVDCCAEHRVPLVISCRTRDQDLLYDVLGTTPSAVQELGDFRFGGEAEHAVDAYCAHYYRGQTAARRREAYDAVIGAAVRGLPMQEVVARPLTLRMLFEVYAPQVPTSEIDAAGLYDAYWAKRVVGDLRHGSAGIVDADDLSLAAEGVARIMLRDGNVAVASAHAVRLLGAAAPGPLPVAAPAALTALHRRNVLTGSGDDGSSTRFFHQTLYEYAAGRCLVSLVNAGQQSDIFERLGRRLEATPDDFLRSVIAEQAIVQGVRDERAARPAAVDLIKRLVVSDNYYLQVTALRAYALLPFVPHAVKVMVHRFLPGAPLALVITMMELLPTHHHIDPRRVTEDLFVILQQHRFPKVQRRALDLLCRFVGMDGQDDGRGAATAVRDLMRDLCIRPQDRVDRVPGAGATRGCPEQICLWSWLLGLPAQEATSHGNHAVRLVTAMASAEPDWAAARMAELLDLAEHHRSARWLWQCIPPISAHRHFSGWGALIERAAVLAEKLGNPDRIRRQNRPAAFVRKAGTAFGTVLAGPGQVIDGESYESEEGEQRAAHVLLAAHWAETLADAPPVTVFDQLVGVGGVFSGPQMRMRARVAALGTRLRTAESGVPELLDHAVARCGDSDQIDDVAESLLPALLRSPGDEPGTRSARDWCARQLKEMCERAPGTRPHRAARFTASGLHPLPAGEIREVVKDAWGGGLGWQPPRLDRVFLVRDSATRLLAPMAATDTTGRGRESKALRRWRALEQERTRQLSRGANDWPSYGDGGTWDKPERNAVNSILHASLRDHAPAHPGLVAHALGEEVALADIPWLAKLVSQAADHPHVDIAHTLLMRHGPELADWCQRMWTGRQAFPDNETKKAALRLWGGLVWMRAAERPSLTAQAGLLTEYLNPTQWRSGLEILARWNAHGVSELAGSAGEKGWDKLDAALAPIAQLPADHPQAGRAPTAAALRFHCLCRFAPLGEELERAHTIEMATEVVRAADTTTVISTTGYLVERLCLVEPSAAVTLTTLVAARTAQQGKHEGHHVKSMVHRWPHPLRHIVRATGYADLERLVRGLSGGPERMLLNVLDLAVALRRDDPVRDDALRWLADSPYLAQATMQLRHSAVRHRRAPLTDPAWPEALPGADAPEYADGGLDR
ncbi:NACHT domain-containing protein [Streptomyces sp. NPDC059489]|uniref:NACHT domain-containing protein n=1 Tax=Streptomyces sp. NPDC059489 TaxID=3346849 RepID=UPI0036991493